MMIGNSVKIIIDYVLKIVYTIRYNFASIGLGCRIYSPLKIKGGKKLILGKSVVINDRTWLEANPISGSPICQLIIGEGSCIGHFNHIYATQSITIGKKVLTADKVYISDNMHTYKDICTPVVDQPIKQLKEVVIGDGAWLGENVCVIGCSVGKGSVVGANSVVTKSIPDFCVAVGSPARIIKRFCFSCNQWKKTNDIGEFV